MTERSIIVQTVIVVWHGLLYNCDVLGVNTGVIDIQVEYHFSFYLIPRTSFSCYLNQVSLVIWAGKNQVFFILESKCTSDWIKSYSLISFHWVDNIRVFYVTPSWLGCESRNLVVYCFLRDCVRDILEPCCYHSNRIVAWIFYCNHKRLCALSIVLLIICQNDFVANLILAFLTHIIYLFHT